MRPKAQHYVPQFYLRNFANHRKSSFYVNCFDKAEGKSFEVNVKNIAHQNSFYDFEIGSEEMVSIEPVLSELEGEVQPAICDLIENPNMECLQNYIEILSLFIYIQEMRTPVFRDIQEDRIISANKKIANILSTQRDFFPEPTENGTKQFQALFMFNKPDEITRIMRKMKWVLAINHTNIPFLTSDNPVFRYNPIVTEFFGNAGLMSEGIQIHYPVSPTLAIIICDPIYYTDIPLVSECTDSHVMFENGGQITNSRQYIFSSDADFSFVRELIWEQPELRNPKRSRTETI